MKTLHIVLIAAVAAGVIALVACSDGLSTDEASPLAHDADKVYGTVTRGIAHTPVEEAGVVLLKKEPAASNWIIIGMTRTNNEGYYEFHIAIWPAGWDGKVDCTADDVSV